MSGPGCVCLLWGCVWSRVRVSALGGCLLQVGSGPGGSAPGGSSLGGSTPRGGGCLLPGGGIPACNEADPLPPVNRMTDRCKNITLATTSLWPVKISCYRGCVSGPGCVCLLWGGCLLQVGSGPGGSAPGGGLLRGEGGVCSGGWYPSMQ